MLPSNSSPKTDQTLKAITVAMEEKSAMNNPKQGSPQEVVPERMITGVDSERKTTERPSCGERVVRAANSMRTNSPPRDNIPLNCNSCDRRFATPRSLSHHQRIHKLGKDLEMQLKKRDPSYSLGQGFLKKPSNSVDFGGHSGDTRLGTYRDPSEVTKGDGGSIKSITSPPFSSGLTRDKKDINMAVGYPVTPYVNTSYGFSSGVPLVTHNNNILTLASKKTTSNNHPTLADFDRLGHSFGPLKSRGGGSSSAYPSLFNGEITMAPPATPYPSFTENTSYGSSSRDPLPYYSCSPHALSLELPLFPFDDIGSCSNNNNNSSSQGLLSLELSLGPSKSTGGSKSNSSGHLSLSGGVTGGGLTDLNMPVPRVSQNQFHSYTPLDSIITRSVPLSPRPPPTTKFSNNDENSSGFSIVKKVIAKAKYKVVDLLVLEDDDEDQPEEVGS